MLAGERENEKQNNWLYFEENGRVGTLDAHFRMHAKSIFPDAI